MVLDPFTITELGIFCVGVIGAFVGLLRVSACETIKCGMTGCACKRARVLKEELAQQPPATELPVIESKGNDDFSKALRVPKK